MTSSYSLSRSESKEELPIYVHTQVLGVDIGDHQRTPEDGTRVMAYGSDTYLDRPGRRYIAAWARRNLFNGAGPQ